MAGALRVGTSGYQYDHWIGKFYPEGMRKSEWFAHYARHFDTVEINNSFYRLPAPATFAKWRQAAPPGFCYAVKYSRFGTHLKHLKDPETHVPRFLASAQELADRLGPILVQLPPRWAPDFDRLREFLDTLPRHRRWAVEVRDPRWLGEELYDCLRRYDAPLVFHDMIPQHPRVLTAGWVYLRYHGWRYMGCYDEPHLRAEARQIADWLAQGLDVFAYFNNDAEGHAVPNALDLRRFTLALAPP